MIRSLLVAAVLFAAPIAACAQSSPREITDGVFVAVLDDGSNVGWVDLGAHSLAVVPKSAGRAAVDRVLALSTVPVRFVVRTGQGPDAALPNGVIELVAGDNASTGSTLVFSDRIEMGSSSRSVVVRDIDPGFGLVVEVPHAQLLFADVLASDVLEAALPSPDAWHRALGRAVRFPFERVVPARGDLTDRAAIVGRLDRVTATMAALDQRLSSDLDETQLVAEVAAVSGITPGIAWHLYRHRAGVDLPLTFITALGLREGPSPTAEDPGWTRPEKVILWNGFFDFESRIPELQRVALSVELISVNDFDEMAREVVDADAVIGWITAPVLARAERLRWVQTFSAGVERIVGIPEMAQSDIVLTNAQRIASTALAEHAMGLALAVSRRLHRAAQVQGTGSWDRGAIARPAGGAPRGPGVTELRGKTLLVAGLGGIGTEVARIGAGFGMRVLATRNSRREGPPYVDYVGLSHELEELAAEADFVVNSLPLTDDTRDVFGAAMFDAMKSTAIFVNVGRGGTVDQPALIEALRSGGIAGAGLDVTVPEPLPSSSPLWEMSNVFITPHYAGDSAEGDDRLFRLLRENLRRFVRGEPMLSVVDKERGY